MTNSNDVMDIYMDGYFITGFSLYLLITQINDFFYTYQQVLVFTARKHQKPRLKTIIS